MSDPAYSEVYLPTTSWVYLHRDYFSYLCPFAFLESRYLYRLDATCLPTLSDQD